MSYLMAGQLSELERLQLQSRVWEPAGRRLLDAIGPGDGGRAVDIGCGCLGWLRLLSQWVGPSGSCVGTDISDDLLAAAGAFVETEGLGNVELVHDDLFASSLPAGSFDLVHARFQLAPLGRAEEQIAALTALLAPGGLLVIEDPDTVSWSYTPEAPRAGRLIALILEAFRDAGGNFDAGRLTADLLRDAGMEPHVRADIVALEAGHPYLRLPLQFAASLRPRLLGLVDQHELDTLLAEVAEEVDDPMRRGLTFTLMQTWAARP